MHVIVGAGFFGGYTTFSTASFETIRLLQERKWVAEGLNGLGVLVTATPPPTSVSGSGAFPDHEDP